MSTVTKRFEYLAFAMTLLATATGCHSDGTATAIRSVLATQADAWNHGDIDAFMDHYEKTDELTFSSGGRTYRGWQATIDRYRTRYPDRSTMGRLTFSNLEITPLAADVALVLGNWQLSRDMGNIGGNFSLVFLCEHGRWVIRHDHTSIDAGESQTD